MKKNDLFYIEKIGGGVDNWMCPWMGVLLGCIKKFF